MDIGLDRQDIQAIVDREGTVTKPLGFLQGMTIDPDLEKALLGLYELSVQVTTAVILENNRRIHYDLQVLGIVD